MLLPYFAAALPLPFLLDATIFAMLSLLPPLPFAFSPPTPFLPMIAASPAFDRCLSLLLRYFAFLRCLVFRLISGYAADDAITRQPLLDSHYCHYFAAAAIAAC